MDELSCSLIYNVAKIESRNIQRRKIATYYSKNIKNSKIIVPRAREKFVAHLFVIRTKNRSDLKKMFAGFCNQIETAIHYPPDHFQKGFENDLLMAPLRTQSCCVTRFCRCHAIQKWTLKALKKLLSWQIHGEVFFSLIIPLFGLEILSLTSCHM